MKNNITFLFISAMLVLLIPTTNINAQSIIKSDSLIFCLPGELWWGGIVNKGEQMPFGKKSFSFNFFANDDGNQSSPLLISNRGRYIWSEKPFRFNFRSDSLIIDKAYGEIYFGQKGSTLRIAYKDVSERFFPASGSTPDDLLFSAPQYNLWIELMYNPNQKDVLEYASQVLKNGLPPGVIMIDDNWTSYYGQFDFDRKKFPDPKQLIDQLHLMGFKVMLWVCPFISADSEPFRKLSRQRLLLGDNSGNNDGQRDRNTRPLILNWWNGYSACLDLSNPAAADWLKERLDFLQTEYGVDGFKFDAGDAFFYNNPNMVSFKTLLPNEHSMLWAEIGLAYSLNEYRAMWKMGGKPLAERLRDKNHSWEDVQKLIPHILSAGLLGYPFSCPDMIGGGELGSFSGTRGKQLDQELIVRSAQCQALMPMMQFSAAPWRVLDSLHLEAVRKAVALRMQFTPVIMKLAKQSSQTGEPIVRHLEYVFPDQGFTETKDAFMLGDSILVVPALQKGATSLTVKLPRILKSKWKSDEGKIYKGGTTIQIDVPLDRLPYFEIVK
jgi:alpha-glucosidase